MMKKQFQNVQKISRTALLQPNDPCINHFEPPNLKQVERVTRPQTRNFRKKLSTKTVQMPNWHQKQLIDQFIQQFVH